MESDRIEKYYRRIYPIIQILKWSDLYGFLEDCGRVAYESRQKFHGHLVLTEINEGSLSGYDVIRLIHRRFSILVSSGTVYSLLYSLERDGLIRGVWNKRKRVYN